MLLHHIKKERYHQVTDTTILILWGVIRYRYRYWPWQHTECKISCNVCIIHVTCETLIALTSKNCHTARHFNIRWSVITLVCQCYCNLVGRRRSGAIEGCWMEQLIGQHCATCSMALCSLDRHGSLLLAGWNLMLQH